MLAKYLIFNSLGFVDFSILSVLEFLYVPALTIYYILAKKNKSLFFLLFLISYSIADILHLIDGSNLSNTLYFLCNSLYILANSFLLIGIFKIINYKKLYKNFLIQTIVLLVLISYLFTVLIELTDPVVFETEHLPWVRAVEYGYNFVLLMLLATSFLNFLEKDTKKSLLLFLGCLAISFSDFLLIGYYYITEINILNYIAIALNITAFVLFCFHSTIETKPSKEANIYA